MKRTLEDILNSHAWHIIHCLSLNHFEVAVSNEYYDKQKQKKAMNSTSRMDIRVDYKYLRAEIWYNKETAKRDWKNKDKNGVVRSLIHEICHIIIDELYFEYIEKTDIEKEDIANIYREQSVEQISRWGWDLYYEYMKENNIKIETGLIAKKGKK